MRTVAETDRVVGVSAGLGGVSAASRRLKAGYVPPRARGGDGAVENCRFCKRGSRRKKKTRKLAGRIKNILTQGGVNKPNVSVTTTNVKGLNLPSDKSSRFGQRTKLGKILRVSDASKPGTGRLEADGNPPAAPMSDGTGLRAASAVGTLPPPRAALITVN